MTKNELLIYLNLQEDAKLSFEENKLIDNVLILINEKENQNNRLRLELIIYKKLFNKIDSNLIELKDKLIKNND